MSRKKKKARTFDGLIEGLSKAMLSADGKGGNGTRPSDTEIWFDNLGICRQTYIIGEWLCQGHQLIQKDTKDGLKGV